MGGWLVLAVGGVTNSLPELIGVTVSVVLFLLEIFRVKKILVF